MAAAYTPEARIAAGAAGRPGSRIERASRSTGLSDDSLNILITSGTFHPDSGGPPTYLRALGRELVERGHTVRVVTYGDEPSKRRYPYPVHRIPRGLPTGSRLALFTREVWRRGRSADLIFVNDYGLPPTLANLVLRKPTVIKIVGDFAWEYAVRHGMIAADEPFERFQGQRYGPRVEALRLMQATYVRAATRVIVPSSFVRWYVEGWGADPMRVRVVKNAVADPTAGIATERAETRTSRGVAADDRLVLVVARLAAWKGVDTVIEALGELRRAGRNEVRLVVVGDGPDRARLAALAAELTPGAVRFTGEIPRDEVGRWMQAADALALCSGYEGLSHVLLEALAAGLPVVASDVGGNKALVRHEHDGLLVPYGDVGATARALASLLSDGELAATIKANARAGAAERTVGRMVDGALDVFQEAIAEHRGVGRAGRGP